MLKNPDRDMQYSVGNFWKELTEVAQHRSEKGGAKVEDYLWGGFMRNGVCKEFVMQIGIYDRGIDRGKFDQNLIEDQSKGN